MRHDASIPLSLHTETAASVKEALGTFWSSIFADAPFVDATIDARVRSAAQLYVDVMENLSLRDHTGSPVFHREHWHPVLIRRSARNTGRGLVVGMPDTPVVGAQTPISDPEGVYLDGEIFVIGGNAEYSRVNTYPFEALEDCRLVKVGTCLCDSISAPQHLLLPERDFTVDRGVLVIRKEQDPFDVSGYRIVEDGDDRVAVLWACDAAFDTDNVSDFIGYPLGFDVASTEVSSKILSTLWDVLVYGLTEQYLHKALGALFDVPTVPSDTTVERVSTADGVSTIVTADAVYRIPEAVRSPAVVYGASLSAGTFLTDELSVHHGVSPDAFSELVADGVIVNLSLPAGSVRGVEDPVVLANRQSVLETGGWFKLNSTDTSGSPFWTAVCERTSEDERKALFNRMKDGSGYVNPLLCLGPAALANVILVRTKKGLCSDPCAGVAFDFLRRLVPSAASLQVVQVVSLSSVSGQGVVRASADDGENIRMDDTVTWIFPQEHQSRMAAADDSVSFTFVPAAVTEV